jgi:hypothetical protein
MESHQPISTNALEVSEPAANDNLSVWLDDQAGNGAWPVQLMGGPLAQIKPRIRLPVGEQPSQPGTDYPSCSGESVLRPMDR